MEKPKTKFDLDDLMLAIKYLIRWDNEYPGEYPNWGEYDYAMPPELTEALMYAEEDETVAIADMIWETYFKREND